MELDLSLILNGESPLLVDEWQVVPAIWDAVRFKVDQVGKKGLFILTGSSSPNQKGILHGGSGRIGSVKMRTMSLFESGNSSGAVSLLGMFDGKINVTTINKPTLSELIEYIIRGGWPGLQGLDVNNGNSVISDYLDKVPDDMERMDGRKRDVRKVRSIITSLGRAESTMMSETAIKKDIEEYAEDHNQFSDVSMSLISDYMDCFTRLFLIEDQPAFEPKLRSSIKSLRSAKHHFSDPSLAVAALKATPDMLMNDLNILGYLFKSLCIRDLRIYADSYDGQIYHYHDEKCNEVDAIVELPNGRWGMI